jgi:hypothetical protein
MVDNDIKNILSLNWRISSGSFPVTVTRGDCPKKLLKGVAAMWQIGTFFWSDL